MLTENEIKSERALLVAFITGDEDYESLDELASLSHSAGAETAGVITQKGVPNAGWLFGKGKVEEIKTFIDANEISLVICDNELSGSRMRNLSEAWDVKLIDRSSLILDIFAMRATSLEGKLQVELAQLKYNLPRLVGVGGRLSKYGGGIGMRGPGEKKLESDKRVIKNNIYDLTERIEKLSSERDLRRKRRNESRLPTVALVGYTNVGKSTIMNYLSGATVAAENKLFATLDPVTRKVYVEGKDPFLLTDTVGFINRLPHEFISAFSSTLEEARDADLLLCVADASAEHLFTQFEVVEKVLSQLKVNTDKMLVVYNKCDLIENDVLMPRPGIKVSASSGLNMDKLKEEIINRIY